MHRVIVMLQGLSFSSLKYSEVHEHNHVKVYRSAIKLEFLLFKNKYFLHYFVPILTACGYCYIYFFSFFYWHIMAELPQIWMANTKVEKLTVPDKVQWPFQDDRGLLCLHLSILTLRSIAFSYDRDLLHHYLNKD